MFGIAAALLAAALVGTASVFSRWGLERESFDVLLLVSLAVAAPIFLVLVALTTGFADSPATGVAYAAVGALFGSVVGRACYFLGIRYVGPGKSLSINATSPLYVALFSFVFLDERITAFVVAGTLLIVAGVAGISGDADAERERAGHSRYVLLFPLVSAVLLAVAATLRKLALSAGLAPIEAGAVNMTVAFAVAAPAVLARRDDPVTDIDRTALKYFVAASLLMAGSFVFYFVGLQRTPANVFYPLIQTQPLYAVGLSALFLGNLEIVTWRTIAAALCIVGGAGLVIVG